MSDTDTQHPVFDGNLVTYGGRTMFRAIGAEDPPAGDPDPDPGKGDPDPADPDPGKGADPAAEAAKWKALARKHEAQAKANADAAKELADLKDGQKSELQKSADKATQADQRATEAERKALQLEVALDKAPDGMSLAQVRKLAKRLAGSTREEFEADAEELFAEFAPDDDAKEQKQQRRPRERLKAGAAPDAEPEETDPKKLAASVPRNW